MSELERRYPHNIFSKEELLVVFGMESYEELIDKIAAHGAVQPIYEGPNNGKYVIAADIEQCGRRDANRRLKKKISELEATIKALRQDIAAYKSLIYNDNDIQ